MTEALTPPLPVSVAAVALLESTTTAPALLTVTPPLPVTVRAPLLDGSSTSRPRLFVTVMVGRVEVTAWPLTVAVMGVAVPAVVPVDVAV